MRVTFTLTDATAAWVSMKLQGCLDADAPWTRDELVRAAGRTATVGALRFEWPRERLEQLISDVERLIDMPKPHGNRGVSDNARIVARYLKERVERVEANARNAERRKEARSKA